MAIKTIQLGARVAGTGSGSDSGIIAYNPNYPDAIERLNWQKHGEHPSILDWGAVADGKLLTDISITSGQVRLTSLSATFTPLDVGKPIAVECGVTEDYTYPDGSISPLTRVLVTTIDAYVSPTQIDLADSASSTVTGRQALYGTDNTDSINTALSSGAPIVIVPRGVFVHADVIDVPSNVLLKGVGWGSVLASTSLTLSAIRFNSVNNSGVEDLKTLCISTWRASGVVDDAGIGALLSSNCWISGVWIQGANGAGVFIKSCTDFEVSGCYGKDTLADGFHVTGDSARVTLNNNQAYNTGDDAYAAQGYEEGEPHEGRPVDISITNNTTYLSKSRGVGTGGTSRVLILGNTITDPVVGGVHVESSSFYHIPRPDNVLVANNTIKGAVGESEFGRWSMQAYQGDHIRFENNLITESDPCRITECKHSEFVNNHLDGVVSGGYGTAVLWLNFQNEDCNVIGNRISNSELGCAIRVDGTTRGVVAGNQLENVQTVGDAALGSITIEGTDIVGDGNILQLPDDWAGASYGPLKLSGTRCYVGCSRHDLAIQHIPPHYNTDASPKLGTTVFSITDASNTTPIVISVTGSHGLIINQVMRIAGVGGNTAANGDWLVTPLSSNTFSLSGSIGNGAYITGGTARRVYATSRRLSVGGDVHGNRFISGSGDSSLNLDQGQVFLDSYAEQYYIMNRDGQRAAYPDASATYFNWYWHKTLIARMSDAGKLGLGAAASYPPVAFLMLPGCTTAAGTAPLKLLPGAKLSSVEDGVFEYDGVDLNFTIGGNRKILASSGSGSLGLQVRVKGTGVSSETLDLYDIDQTKAFSNLTITAVPSNGQTVLINTTTYTFVTTLTGANQVWIQPTKEECLFGLYCAINDISPWEGYFYGTGTAAHTTCEALPQTGAVMKVQFKTAGTSGNGTDVGGTAPVTWSADPMSGGSNGTAPHKYLMVTDGAFTIKDNAFTSQIFKVYDNGDMRVYGPNTSAPADVNFGIFGRSAIRFSQGATEEASSGSIVHGSSGLQLFGYGSSAANRIVKLWDHVGIGLTPPTTAGGNLAVNGWLGVGTATITAGKKFEVVGGTAYFHAGVQIDGSVYLPTLTPGTVLGLSAGNIVESVVVPVSSGGTGATTAGSAVSNLGAAFASHTHTSSDMSGRTGDFTVQLAPSGSITLSFVNGILVTA